MALLLDVKRFYDPVNRRVIDLAENYLGVAARVGAIGYRLGLTRDRAPLDALIDRAVEPFSNGRLYSDDAPPNGRYDRYSNEYARYVWDAATQANRPDIQAILRPSLTSQMRLWWDLVDGDDGYGYPWGRSLGIVSYMDTLEIVAFLAQNPEFRPAPLADLVSQYARAWNYLRHDYRDDRHLLSLFEFGRGNFSYISLDREWQQTTGFLGKVDVANAALAPVVERERLTAFPARPRWPASRGSSSSGRRANASPACGSCGRDRCASRCPSPPDAARRRRLSAGAARSCRLRRAGRAECPALVPHLELADGRTIVAADGADEIQPSPDGRQLRVVWRRWAQPGTRSGQLIDPGVTSEVRWTIADGVLTRRETLTAPAPVVIRAWRVAVPTTASTSTTANEMTTLSGANGELHVSVTTPWTTETSVRATGNGVLGRGARGAIPLDARRATCASRRDSR